MKNFEADLVLKAIVDGVDEYAVIAERAGVDPALLMNYDEVLDRAIQLLRGFYKYGHENMKPVGLPPPKNPYYTTGQDIDEQRPEYYAFEAVMRGSTTRQQCLMVCGKFGVDAADAEVAFDNVIIPWREANAWRSYAQEKNGRFVLMDKPPMKLKRFLDRFLEQLLAD